MDSYLVFATDTLNQISTVTALKWALLGFVCLLVIGIMYLEQRRMQRYYHRLTSAASSQDTAALDYSLKLLTRLSRSILLLSVAFVILTFSVITYDIKKHHVDTMRLVMEERAWCETGLDIHSPSQPTPSPAQNDSAIELAEPLQRTASPEQEQKLDELKQTYEKSFISYYMLKACGMTGINDALVINNMLMLEMEEHNAPALLPKTIREAAHSTYKGLYISTECDSPTVKSALESHLLYIQQLRESLNKRININ